MSILGHARTTTVYRDISPDLCLFKLGSNHYVARFKSGCGLIDSKNNLYLK